eukprot:TRINITY_DN461_c0_g2_i3.p2 TRINITY_DN461_c0_g2~~TRINITY_DN461_c0_g2_i3.p2  ORF type:complete len:130 (+),score=14.21 TRINITY_DN461_c0_g2_i3:2200-2589(+)
MNLKRFVYVTCIETKPQLYGVLLLHLHFAETLPEPKKIRPGEANEDALLSEFQQELIQLAASLNGDDTLLSFPEGPGKNMTVKEGTAYLQDAVKRFMEAGLLASSLGASEDEIVQMRPSLTTRPATSVP